MTSPLIQNILTLKKQKNAIILAHYYQESEIQDIADYVGDSLGLSQEAKQTNADLIVFAGVHFMAETAKILNPTKKVILPDLAAGCSLADSCKASDLAALKQKHPDHLVVSYINCTAETKALSDIICTSSNAVKIVNSLPKDQKIIFAPDQHLGRYVMQQTGRDMLLWQGACIVHEIFSAKKIVELKTANPDALVIAHPECDAHVLSLADHIGSTSSLLAFAEKNAATTFIVVTEAGIIHQMKKANPEKTFIPAPTTSGCACNECPYMRLNTMEKLYQCMKDETPEITLSPDLIEKARRPIERMLELSI